MYILDLSKIVMYNFHYDFIMQKYPQAKLLFTDTDSFCYHIPTETSLYEGIKDNKWFDFSNYDENHDNFSENNKLVPGKFKDEMGGRLIEEFGGLRSKMYSIKKEDGKEKKAAKGILTVVKEKKIYHEDYKECLFKRKQMNIHRPGSFKITI